MNENLMKSIVIITHFFAFITKLKDHSLTKATVLISSLSRNLIHLAYPM